MSSWLGTGPLVGDRVTLRPLTIDDAPTLARVVGDPDRFRWSPGVPIDLASARRFIETATADPDARVAFAVVDNIDGTVVGSTSFYEIDEANRSVCIGYTFYAERVQGTTVNPTAKYLLLRRAFEDCGAVRITWHTHEHNTQSRAAIAKLGARFEGLLRKHRRFGDGWRTTALYSMIDDEWPDAKAALLQRIS
ncbi:GNAT family N-acetyltransferase [Gordonia sp. GONU]|uniref:GNAT family N-acetyltransferase n=1 Tax=Gordonia TaxID=2053 RepID=UPI0021AC1073|nr:MULTISPECIES: GNAT family protein [Gordonia]MCR8898254.1 GNAT family N-acetyltransferase [Gordonia sp. GONU]MCZ0915293.1 GNAT family protein [Gordonia amicalis]